MSDISSQLGASWACSGVEYNVYVLRRGDGREGVVKGCMSGSMERKTEREQSLGLPTVVALQQGVIEGVVLSLLYLCRICVLFSKSEDELLK